MTTAEGDGRALGTRAALRRAGRDRPDGRADPPAHRHPAPPGRRV